MRSARDRGIPILEVSRAELDRMTGGVLHQGVGLQVPPFAYEPFEDLLAVAGTPEQRRRLGELAVTQVVGAGLNL